MSVHLCKCVYLCASVCEYLYASLCVLTPPPYFSQGKQKPSKQGIKEDSAFGPGSQGRATWSCHQHSPATCPRPRTKKGLRLFKGQYVIKGLYNQEEKEMKRDKKASSLSPRIPRLSNPSLQLPLGTKRRGQPLQSLLTPLSISTASCWEVRLHLSQCLQNSRIYNEQSFSCAESLI